MNILIFVLIILEITCNVAAQMSLKMGMERIGGFSFEGSSIVPIGLQVITSPWIMLGISIYVMSLIIWLMILSRAEVSMAYPMTSLGYALTVLIAYFLFGEHVSILRIFGVLVIMLGVFIVARSGT
jgi:drug/metabolite transporter (DMT)-like permease